MERECDRYGLDRDCVAAILQGEDTLAKRAPRRRWWELAIVGVAIAVFVWLASIAQSQPLAISIPWMMVLSAASLMFLLACGFLLWKRTRFS